MSLNLLSKTDKSTFSILIIGWPRNVESMARVEIVKLFSQKIIWLRVFYGRRESILNFYLFHLRTSLIISGSIVILYGIYTIIRQSLETYILVYCNIVFHVYNERQLSMH